METMGLNADLADLGLNEDPLHNEEVASSQPTEDGMTSLLQQRIYSDFN